MTDSVRLLHAADIHSGLTALGNEQDTRNSRLNDTERAYAALIDESERREAAAILLCGDTFNVRNPGPQEIRSFLAFERRCEEVRRKLLAGSGNHDGPGTIRDVETKTNGWMADLNLPMLHAYPAPTIDRVVSEHGEFVVVSLPYAHKRTLTTLKPEWTLLEQQNAAGVELERMIIDLGEEARKRARGVPVIFMGHLSVYGGSPGSEQELMQMGWDVMVSQHVFDGYDYAALGHLHPQQKVSDKAWYAGSPQYVNFKEENQRKGFLAVTVTAGGLPEVESVSSNPRPMLTIEVGGGHTLPTDFDLPEGAIVRLRTLPDADPKVVETLYAQLLLRASFVKKDPVREERPARVRIEMSSDGGVIQNTSRWLVADGKEPERYLARAADLLARRKVK